MHQTQTLLPNLVADAKQSETITQINELKQTIDAADN